MKKNEVTSYLLESLGDSRRKTVKMNNELLKYFSRKGSIGMVARELEKRSGHPCSLEIDCYKRRIYIKNTEKLITKSTLRKRWSDKLIEIFLVSLQLRLETLITHALLICAFILCRRLTASREQSVFKISSRD